MERTAIVLLLLTIAGVSRALHTIGTFYSIAKHDTTLRYQYNCDGMGIPLAIPAPGVDNRLQFRFSLPNGVSGFITTESAGHDRLGDTPTISMSLIPHATSWAQFHTMSTKLSVDSYSNNVFLPPSSIVAYFGFVGKERNLTLNGSQVLSANVAYRVAAAARISVPHWNSAQSYSIVLAFGYHGVYTRFEKEEFTLWPGELFVPLTVDGSPHVRVTASVTGVPVLDGSQEEFVVSGRNRVFQIVGAIDVKYINGSSILRVYELDTQGKRIDHYFVDQVEGSFVPFAIGLPGATTIVQIILEGDELYGNGNATIRLEMSQALSTNIPWHGMLQSCSICPFTNTTIIGPMSATLAENSVFSLVANTRRCLSPRQIAPHEVLGTPNCTMNNLKTHFATAKGIAQAEGDVYFYMGKPNSSSWHGNTSIFSLKFGGAWYNFAPPGFNVRVTVVGGPLTSGVGVQTLAGMRFLALGQSVRFCTFGYVGQDLLVWNVFSSKEVTVKVERYSLHLIDSLDAVTDECINTEFTKSITLTPLNNGNPIVANRINSDGSDTIAIPLSPHSVVAFASRRYFSLGYALEWVDPEATAVSLMSLSKEGFPGMLLKQYSIQALTIFPGRCSCQFEWQCAFGSYGCLTYNMPNNVTVEYGSRVVTRIDSNGEYQDTQYAVHIPDSGVLTLQVNTNTLSGPGLLIVGGQYNGEDLPYRPYRAFGTDPGATMITASVNVQTVTLCGSPGMTLFIQAIALGTGEITFTVIELTDQSPPVLTIIANPKSQSLVRNGEYLYCESPSPSRREVEAYVQRNSHIYYTTVAFGDCTSVSPEIYDYSALASIDRKQECNMFRGSNNFLPELWTYQSSSASSYDTLILTTDIRTLTSYLFVSQSSSDQDLYKVTFEFGSPSSNEFVVYKIADENGPKAPVSSSFERVVFNGTKPGSSVSWSERVPFQSVLSFGYSFCFIDKSGGYDFCDASILANRAYFINTEVRDFYPSRRRPLPTPPSGTTQMAVPIVVSACFLAIMVGAWWYLIRRRRNQTASEPLIPQTQANSSGAALPYGSVNGLAPSPRGPAFKDVTQSFAVNNAYGSFCANPEGEMSVCCICFDNPRNTMAMPCKHLFACEDCAKKLKNCPLCRVAITEFNVVRLPVRED